MINPESFLSTSGRQLQESAIRKMGTVLASGRDVISFAPGYPAPETFPWDEFAAIAAELFASRDANVLQYGPTRGYRPLLDVITGIMRSRGVSTPTDQLLVTTGSQQGLDLVARVLLDPRDVALVELPAYTGALAAFRNAQATLAGVRQDADGIDIDHLVAVTNDLRAKGLRPRFLYVVPNFQNPTGVLLATSRRGALLDAVATLDLLLVEDDPYGDLYFREVSSRDETRPIKADDRDGRVIYLSSFSKTLAPGFRVGWMTGPPAIVSRCEIAKQALDLCSGALDQRVVWQALVSGVIAAQAPKLRRHYEEKRDTMAAALTRAFEGRASWENPRGGFFLWTRLPDGLDAEALLPRALEKGVLYVVGRAFHVDGGGRDRVRLCFSAPRLDRIDEGVRRLAEAVGELAETARTLSP
jgi:2-aminoadipate transaminase